jgi:hypothetical protein
MESKQLKLTINIRDFCVILKWSRLSRMSDKILTVGAIVLTLIAPIV